MSNVRRLGLLLVGLLDVAAAGAAPRRVPPYGVIQFGVGAMKNSDIWSFLLRAHVNLCESAVSTPVSECWGWGDRKPFEAAMAAARAQAEAAHKVGVKTVAYVAYHPFYGDADQRSGLFEFYDHRWSQYEDYLGPRPPDPIEWTKRDSNGKPIPFSYEGSHGYYICPNNPYWLQYLQGCLHLLADCGVDGIRYDGPVDPCWCRYCRDAFARWLGRTYTAQELAERLKVTDLAEVKVPTAENDPLQFPWRRYCMFRQGETVAETGAFARRFNPNFIMSYNYCIWSGDVPGSSRNEDLAAASDYGLIEGNFDSTAHSEGGRKHSASADCKYLVASGDGKPMNLYYYLYGTGTLREDAIARWSREKVEGNALFYKAAMAEGMFGGCPYPIMPDRIHANSRQAVVHYADFFYRQRPYLTDARTYANVALLASISQTCANLPSFPLSVSRYLADHHVPHVMVLDRDLTLKRLKQFDALVLPEARLLSETHARAISAFIKGGRGLVAFGPVGTRDEYNEELPASSLSDLLGVSGREFPDKPFQRRAGRGRIAWFPSPRLPTTGRWPLPADGLKDLEGFVPALQWAAGGKFSGTLEAPDMVELNLMRSPDGKVLLAHLMNYNIEAPARLTTYENLRLELLLPRGKAPRRVTLLSPDLPTERTELPFSVRRRGGWRFLDVTVPKIAIYNLIAVELPGARLTHPPGDAPPPVELAVRGEPLAAPGQRITLVASVSNRTSTRARGVSVDLTAPSGWWVEPISLPLGDIPGGQSRSVEFTLEVPKGAPVENAADVLLSAGFTLAGGAPRKVAALHRVLVRKAVNISVAAQKDV